MLIDVVTTKDETPIKKICETDEGPIKEQDVHPLALLAYLK